MPSKDKSFERYCVTGNIGMGIYRLYMAFTDKANIRMSRIIEYSLKHTLEEIGYTTGSTKDPVLVLEMITKLANLAEGTNVTKDEMLARIHRIRDERHVEELGVIDKI